MGRRTGYVATDPGLGIRDSLTPARARVRTLESAPRRSSMRVSFFLSLFLFPSFSLPSPSLFAPSTLSSASSSSSRIPSQFVRHANFLLRRLTSSRRTIPLSLFLFLFLFRDPRISSLGRLQEPRERREGRFLRQGRARGRIVWCCWNTRRENERVSRSHGVVRSCANRECYATREPPTGGCLSLSFSLFLSLSLSGRDDGVEGRTRGLQKRGGRGAEISPRGSVTNSIRRGRGEGRDGSGG